MTFSIQKKPRIQIFSLHKKDGAVPFHNPSHAEILGDIDRNSELEMRASLERLSQITAHKVERIVNDTSLSTEIGNLGVTSLQKYFQKHPSAWNDLKRKLHRYRSFSNQRHFIAKEDEEQILSVFLRLGRDYSTAGIENDFRVEIFNNQKLLSQASSEPSVLDSSHGTLQFLSKTEQIGFIKKMIQYGISINTDMQMSESADKQVMKFLPHILCYLRSIFHISFDDIDGVKNFRDLSQYIVKRIWSDGDRGGEASGREAKEAWMLVKAFFGWGSYFEIDRYRDRISRLLHDLIGKMGENHIAIESRELEMNGTIEEPVAIQHGKVSLQISDGSTFTCNIEYRIKGLRSILLKMWESEEYANIDAMRDMIGIAIIWPDDTPINTKIEVIEAFSQVMANKGYIIKNKGLLDKNGEKQLRAFMQDASKKPLGKIVSSHAKKSKSHADFSNISISGFTSVRDTVEGKESAMGCEIQFFNQSGAAFWKKDHYTFDPLKVVSAWSRGSWFLTPHQMLVVIRHEIPEDVREGVLKKRTQEILWDYIEQGAVCAYVGEGNQVYLTPKQHEDHFCEKFPKTKKIIVQKKGDDILDPREKSQLKHFIDNLSLHGA